MRGRPNFYNAFLINPFFVPPIWEGGFIQDPPTLQYLLNSIVNVDSDTLEDVVPKTRKENLAEKARTFVFNFDYPLSDAVNKADFEKMILNHFIHRRIGFETYQLWHIYLDNKMNEIMPFYNRIFDALKNYGLFDRLNTEKHSAEKYQENVGISEKENKDRTYAATETTDTNTTNQKTDNTTSNTDTSLNSQTNSSADETNKYSDTPQDDLQGIIDNRYLTDYRAIHNTASATAEDSSNTSFKEDMTSDATGTLDTKFQKNDDTVENRDLSHDKDTAADTDRWETLVTDIPNRLDVLITYQKEFKNVMTQIYNDLDCLFYQMPT